MKIAYLFVLSLLVGCDQTPTGESQISTQGYAFATPDQVVALSGELKEISGLTYYDEQQLLCIEDEHGIIYKIDAHTGEIVHRIKFGAGRDYEGITYFDHRAYVVESDGDLFEISGLDLDQPIVKKFENKLTHKNNVEGLTYWANPPSLLMGCKDDPGKKMNKKRAIYRFDLAEEKVKKKPFCTLDLIAIEQHIVQQNLQALSPKLRKQFGFRGDLDHLFRPSGIAIHPITKQLFVLSSHSPMLLILNEEFEIDDVISLPSKQFRQPEGITFAPDGTLFISTEADGKVATLARFNYLN